MKYSVRRSRSGEGVRRLHAAARRAAILCIGIAALAGCVPPRVVQYTSFHDRDFARRDRPAAIQQKSTAELLGGGYLLIGYIDLRRNVRTCYEDGLCTDHSDGPPIVGELAQEAAQRGGDVVTLLEERTVLEPHNKSHCTQTSVQVITINNKRQTITTCVAYRTVKGKLEAKISRALIWRHDPAAAESEANARAIEAALRTLEAAQPIDAAADTSFLGALGLGRKDGPTARDDALSRRIHAAIADDDARALQALGREGKIRGWSDANGRTALMVALSAGRLQAARALLAIDKGFDRRDNRGQSALHYAAARADLELVRELVAAGYDVKVKTAAGASLLYYALLNARLDVFEWLVSQGLDPRERTDNDETALMVAAEAGTAGAVRRLLKLGLDPNARDRDGRTALLMAARGARPEAVRLLLAARARHDVADEDGNGALHYAAKGGDRAVIDLLLKRGLRLEAENGRRLSALSIAMASEQWDAARYLIERGAPLTTSKLTAEDTALHLIAKNQQPLLERYATAFAPLRLLLARDPGWLQYAAKTSGRETIRYLAGLGARIDRPDARGFTPLMTAAAAGNHDAVGALLELQANPALRNRSNQTALEIATLASKAKVVETLRAFGVRD